MSSEQKKFYLTTPIYYVNARPHIGHAYTTIVADVLARRHRLLGDDTFFLTGTDEHGQKIERSAAAAGIPPQQFADKVSAEFKALWDRMGLTYDRYIRTTDERHKLGVEKLFTALFERGFIYLDSYTGSYCVSDEAFVDAPAGTPCPDCGRLLETVTEENFFFKLSAFQLPLLDLIESKDEQTQANDNPKLSIKPLSARREVQRFLNGDVTDVILEEAQPFRGMVDDKEALDRGEKAALQNGRLKKTALGSKYVPDTLRDLSVSRSSFTWGISVPDHILKAAGAKQKHVIYVWLDALANYMTAVGYGSDDPKDKAEFDKYWPADLHLVGKEITRFHCVYWPAFLLALNPKLQHDRKEIPPQLSIDEHRRWAEKCLPKAVTAHGWLLFDNAKMSKSKGNIVRTETILEAFGEHVYGKQFPESTKRERDLFATDVLRYFLLREIPFGQDGSFSFDALVTRYNADLANGYGNLASRVLNLIFQNFEGNVPHSGWDSKATESRIDVSVSVSRLVEDLVRFFSTEGTGFLFQTAQEYGRNNFSELLFGISSGIANIDQFFASTKPWVMAKNRDLGDLPSVLYSAAEGIRILTALLYPILPFATAKVWVQLGLGDIELAANNGELNNLEWGGLKPGTKLGPLAPIFPRAPKELADIMAEIEEKNANAAQGLHPAAEPQTQQQLEPNPPGGAPALVPPTEETIKPEPIGIDDFAKIELRVAKILIAERIPKADKLLRLEVDLGYEKRQILSGIAEWYAPEDLIGRRIVVITNLAPRKMRGLESHGMLLAASETEGSKPILATMAEEIALGSRLK